MIDRIDLFHLPFYKKEAFTGSDRGLRFWIGKTDTREEGAEEEKLRKKDWMRFMSGFWEKGEAWSVSRNEKRKALLPSFFHRKHIYTTKGYIHC